MCETNYVVCIRPIFENKYLPFFVAVRLQTSWPTVSVVQLNSSGSNFVSFLGFHKSWYRDRKSNILREMALSVGAEHYG